MARDLQLLATKSALSPASRELLARWLVGCKTGDAKLRAIIAAGAPLEGCHWRHSAAKLYLRADGRR